MTTAPGLLDFEEGGTLRSGRITFDAPFTPIRRHAGTFPQARRDVHLEFSLHGLPA
jgi:hypothetical protein